MALIRFYDHIYCDACGQPIKVGLQAYESRNRYLCETCFDKAMARVKAEARVEVNRENFDLEVEE